MLVWDVTGVPVRPSRVGCPTYWLELGILNRWKTQIQEDWNKLQVLAKLIWAEKDNWNKCLEDGVNVLKTKHINVGNKIYFKTKFPLLLTYKVLPQPEKLHFVQSNISLVWPSQHISYLDNSSPDTVSQWGLIDSVGFGSGSTSTTSLLQYGVMTWYISDTDLVVQFYTCFTCAC